MSWDHRSVCCKLSIHRLEPITTSYYKTSCCVSRLCVAKLLFYFAGFSQQKFKDVVFEMFCVKQPFGESRPHSACKWMKIFPTNWLGSNVLQVMYVQKKFQTSTFKWAYSVVDLSSCTNLIIVVYKIYSQFGSGFSLKKSVKIAHRSCCRILNW